MFNLQRSLILGLVFCLVAVNTTWGGASGFERLTSRAPEDATMVLGTSGLAELKPAMTETVLGRLVMDPNVQAFVKPLWQQAMTMMEVDANDVEDASSWLQTGLDVLRNPILFSMGLHKGDGDVDGYGALIIDCQIGKDSLLKLIDLFREEIEADQEIVKKDIAGVSVETFVDEDEVPVYWGWAGSHFVFGLNDVDGKVLQAVQKQGGGKSLTQVPASGDLFSMHLDVEQIWSLWKQIIDSDEDLDLPEWLPKVLQRLGLRQLDTIVARSGFKRGGLVMDEHLGFSEKPSGLFSLWKPVDRAVFEMVDGHATEAGAWDWDVQGTVDLILEVVSMVDPNALNYIDDAWEQAQANTGTDVRKDLVENLTGSMFYYTVPMGSHDELPMGGTVVLAQVKDPDRFAEAMTKLEAYAQSRLQGQLMVTTQDGDYGELHVWTAQALMMAQIMPTWTMAGDLWVLASNANLADHAVDMVADEDLQAKSLAKQKPFKQALRDVPKDALYIQYGDTRKQYQQIYQGAQQMWPLVMMMAMQQNIALNAALPKIDHIIEDAKPACTYVYSDETGIYSHTEGIQADMNVVVAGAFTGGIMIPALAESGMMDEWEEEVEEPNELESED